MTPPPTPPSRCFPTSVSFLSLKERRKREISVVSPVTGYFLEKGMCFCGELVLHYVPQVLDRVGGTDMFLSLWLVVSLKEPGANCLVIRKVLG